MKKVLIIIMLLFLTIIVIDNEKEEVEADIDFLFDFVCDTPRFVYTRYSEGSLYSPMSCEVRTIQADLYFDEVENFQFWLRVVDKDGNLVKNVETLLTDFQRENDDITSTYYVHTVSDVANGEVIDLRPIISGEFKEVTRVYNLTTNTEIDPSEYNTAGSNVLLSTFENSYNLNDTIYVFYDKYDSTTYTYTYTNASILQELEYEYKLTSGETDTNLFYQFIADGRIIYTGMIGHRLDYVPNEYTSGYHIEVGDFMFDSDLYDDVDSYTYNYSDGYFLLHYKKDPLDVDNLQIKFYDISTGTIVDTIDMNDIFNYQGGNDNARQYSFIPLPINNTVGEEIKALDVTGYSALNPLPNAIRTFNLGEGVYLVTLETSSGVLLDYSDRLLIIDPYNYGTDVTPLGDLGDPFDLVLLYEEISINDSQTVQFRTQEYIRDFFNTVEAKDLGINYDYYESINIADNIVSISYKPLSTLSIGDVVAFRWIVEPKSLPHSLDVSDFRITITEEYTIRETVDTKDLITGFSEYWGLGDSGGLLFLSIFIILLVNILLVFILAQFEVRGYIVYVFVNGGVLLLEYSLGWLPTWVGVLLGLLLSLGLLFLFSRRGDDV